MLGHLKPRACQLSSISKNHYQHLYCSLCFSLRQQFGLSSSILINHELTLSLAAISATQNLTLQQCACPAKLFCGEKTIVCDPVVDKAARLCVLLIWLKLVDSQIDNPALYKKGLQVLLNNSVQEILKELSIDTQQFITEYLVLIQENNDFLTTAKMSGLLAKKVFAELSDDYSISEITLLLGELITVADALLDLNSDLKQQQYNPIIVASEQNQMQLKQEYLLLLNNYLALAEQIKEKLLNDAINPLFKELLTQSLKNLTARIYRVNNALFADNTNNAQQRRRNRTNQTDSNSWCCLDCCDCCQCCGECGSNAEGASGCCDCCACDCSC